MNFFSPVGDVIPTGSSLECDGEPQQKKNIFVINISLMI